MSLNLIYLFSKFLKLFYFLSALVGKYKYAIAISTFSDDSGNTFIYYPIKILISLKYAGSTRPPP